MEMVTTVKKRRDPYKLRRLRQIVQIGFLVVFSFLLVRALFGIVLESTMPLLILTITFTILTLILGRVWCGWVCPMGTILYFTRFKSAKGQGMPRSSRIWTIKYILLVLIIVAALLGFVNTALDWMGDNTVATSIGILLLVGGSIVLNLKADLFWCRYLCPLGAAVGLVSKIAPMRRVVHAHCNDCSICVDSCPMGVVDPQRRFVNDPGECTVCIDCMTECTSSSNGFRFVRPFGKEEA